MMSVWLCEYYQWHYTNMLTSITCSIWWTAAEEENSEQTQQWRHSYMPEPWCMQVTWETLLCTAERWDTPMIKLNPHLQVFFHYNGTNYISELVVHAIYQGIWLSRPTKFHAFVSSLTLSRMGSTNLMHSNLPSKLWHLKHTSVRLKRQVSC